MPEHRPLFSSVYSFLVLVGVVSSAIVVAIILLNIWFPRTDEIMCENSVTGQYGLAERGRGNTIISSVETDGIVNHKRSASDLTCLAVFGEGFHDVRTSN